VAFAPAGWGNRLPTFIAGAVACLFNQTPVWVAIPGYGVVTPTAPAGGRANAAGWE
jgi:hypothetical protein